MPRPLAVLFVEDSENDAILMLAELEQGGFEVSWARVESADDMRRELARSSWDVILADYSLPQFSGVAALKLLRESCLDIPLILVSGTIGDERAVETLLSGAADFVAKDRLARLVPAIERELRETAMRIERRQAEAALRFSEQKYRQLFETLSDAAVLIDDQTGSVLEANLHAQHALGIDRTRMAGLALRDLHQPDALDVVGRTILEAVRATEPRSVETVLIGRDQMNIPVLVTAIQVVVANRRLLLLLYRDLTEQRQAQDKLRLMHEELERRVEERTAQLKESMAELEAFSYSVSHDLRAPLRGVDGIARALQDPTVGNDEPERTRLLRLIRQETSRMAQLIDDILAFSRVGRQPLDASVVDMAALAQGTFQELTEMRDTRRVELDLGALPPAFGDRSMLRQVLTNLLANAIKFTRNTETPRITIRGAVAGQLATYTVTDNGVGFNPAYVERLFAVFQRLHSDADFEGTGVGLAIVKRIVDRHGGRVSANGEVGRGATFTFTLPSPPRRASPTQPPASTATRPGRADAS
jgi:PAS domain S-box-containing protein